MNEDKKKYTLDDWLNNRLPKTAFQLYQEGSMSAKTLQKIIEAKERAFEILVELRATWKYDSFIHYLKRTQNPSEYLKYKIKSLETINERTDLLELIHGPGGSLPVDGEMYQYLKECEERDKGINWSLPAERIEVFNEHKKLNAKISYRFLQKLKDYNENGIENEDKKELSDKEIYKKILNTPQGITAGKMAFFRNVRQNGSYRNNDQVFNKADKIHREIKGKYLYKNRGVFEVRQSQFLKETPDAQNILKKILKPFK